MRERIASVSIEHYPILKVKFQDGLEGELDLAEEIRTKPMFKELEDEDFFRSVSVGSRGHWLGWKLDRIGEEIDLSADGIRNDIEKQIVKRWAQEYRDTQKAADQ